MDALASAYSDDDGSGSDCGAADSSPHRREESETPGGAAKRPRLAPLEAPHRTVAEMHVESLVRLQSECPLLPSESAAEARRAQWKWFRNICDAEFSDAIGAEAGTGIGLQLFGSWSYDMWVSSSDFDANMFMLSRIPNFFPRLKRAVLAAHPSAEALPESLAPKPCLHPLPPKRGIRASHPSPPRPEFSHSEKADSAG